MGSLKNGLHPRLAHARLHHTDARWSCTWRRPTVQRMMRHLVELAGTRGCMPAAPSASSACSPPRRTWPTCSLTAGAAILLSHRWAGCQRDVHLPTTTCAFAVRRRRCSTMQGQRHSHCKDAAELVSTTGRGLCTMLCCCLMRQASSFSRAAKKPRLSPLHPHCPQAQLQELLEAYGIQSEAVDRCAGTPGSAAGPCWTL
jgi:hypothetical protein